MRVLTMWYGGHSYSQPDYADMDRYGSVEFATRIFRYRRYGADSFYPCVDETSYMDIYRAVDGMPICRLSFGPRGGVVRTDLWGYEPVPEWFL